MSRPTGVFKFVGDCGTAVGSGLVGKEVGQGPLFSLANDGQGKFDKLSPSLRRGAAGRGDVVKVFLAVHKGEVEFPELVRTDTCNLREGDVIYRLDLIAFNLVETEAYSQCDLVNEGRTTVPWLDLLPDDCLYLSVVFAPFLDEGLDGSIEVVSHFTTVESGVSHPAYVDR